ncbi:hypothetical protein [Pedobacter sp. CFBP9032]|uniref:hypothetical protein n=1 Tax=Pedobacter sp. CFBP9032 TaxID=3096539 RepID=UPI002A6B76E4|nr:hypothetical protein [Pedobacter sp. CFBP9032]MDY0904524.1 hypothetical protein [Pedobacter sp. CFBP9032]
MKSALKFSSLLFLFHLLFVACKKENKDEVPTGPLGPKYPQVINNVITPEIMESLKKNGMTINSGTTPPTLNGVFLFSPAYAHLIIRATTFRAVILMITNYSLKIRTPTTIRLVWNTKM